MHKSGRISRRKALIGGLSSAILLGTGQYSTHDLSNRVEGDPFTLGIASGDPLPDGVVLWTRLAPHPMAEDGAGGMEKKPVSVQWQVAEDENFRKVVKEGIATATPELAHSVHPEINGLKSDWEYFYRFKAGKFISPVGRTRTAPGFHDPRQRVRFGFASCQRWDHGYYTAFDHMAEDDLDFVAHLGDYIYEVPFTSSTNLRGVEVDDILATRPTDLRRYRTQYAHYKSDLALQSAHAAFAWITVFDDHEVEDDWAGDQSGKQYATSKKDFISQRAAAFQARYEHLPLRIGQKPHGATTRDYRAIRYGALADFYALDTRQYRDPQPCGDVFNTSCPERAAPERVMMGNSERNWFVDNLASSTATWKIALNQVQIMQLRLKTPPLEGYKLDSWDGYPGERTKLLHALEERKLDNVVVVTGDAHKNYAGDLALDFDDPGAKIVASEFVGSSISSNGDGGDVQAKESVYLADNPHLKFFNDQRGYVRCDLTAQQCQVDYQVLDYVERPGSPISQLCSYVVENGRNGMQEA